MNQNLQKGFTLVELLVVIALIAVLSVAVILTLNPAELLKQGRDSTRISDLANINSAISLYLADVNTSTWTGVNSNYCYVHASAGATNCTARFSGGTLATSSSQLVNGTGWIPINLNLISSASPLPRYPVDPTNVSPYYYAFKVSSTYGFYEINALLESSKYNSQAVNDGGNSNSTSTPIYEVGTDLSL